MKWPTCLNHLNLLCLSWALELLFRSTRGTSSKLDKRAIGVQTIAVLLQSKSFTDYMIDTNRICKQVHSFHTQSGDVDEG